MRRLVVLACLTLGCPANPPPQYYAPAEPDPRAQPFPQRVPPADITKAGRLDDRMVDYQFDGGQLEFEMYRLGTRIVQTVRSRYAVAVMVAWTISSPENLQPVTAMNGAVYVPPAAQPLGLGPVVVLAEMELIDPTQRYRRELSFRARFGDPRVRPVPYAYALPYPRGQTFSVLQGFHGGFSHRGSNEYAVDFDCPVATPVLATRPGIVVAANATAQGSGTTQEYLDYKRTNFVIVQHDDGSLGEYMHLAPATIQVKPGQHVQRLQELALSGNTGFSSTPHLHFQVMTAAYDGVGARSFAFEMAIAPNRVEEPTLSHRYTAWETPTAAPPMR
ncbi:MAG: M23 family metallopeptidase [Deltaproteobacteria bacterium]|nr:M23 family metallopeptidase [Deltaproteobacteria bacterium]